MELHALISLVRAAPKRSQILEAMRRLVAEYPDQAPYEVDRILVDKTLSMRVKGIVLYFLDSHGVLPQVRGKYMADPELRVMADHVERAIEGDEEDGIDPFQE